MLLKGCQIKGASFTGATIYDVVVGTQAPTLGAGPVASWPPAGQTSLVNAYADDAFTTVNLPFTFTINNTGYNICYPGSNFYITFGSGSTVYTPINNTSPALNKFHLGAADWSWYNVGYKSNGSYWITIRCEGYSSSGGGSPLNMIYEFTFINPANMSSGFATCEVRFGTLFSAAGVFGVANTASYYATDAVAANSSWVFEATNAAGTAWTLTKNRYVNFY